MLKLMYITNDPEIASIAENAGVDRIFVDMEYIGKSDRQGGMDTVQSFHTVEDVKRIRKAIKKAELMVRVNPLHDATDKYCSSEDEINAVIEAGADLVMLPYFHNAKDIERFISYVDGRAKVFPLLESKDALLNVDEILAVPGIDEIHVGINDLSLDLGKRFMFELLADGTVEYLCKKFKEKGLPYGFGGIGRIGTGDIHAEYVIKEHYRLGSGCAILSRSFCNVNKIADKEEITNLFTKGIKDIRELEAECQRQSLDYFEYNRQIVKEKVAEIVGTK